MFIAGSTFRWLLFLLIPYFIGMVIHFLIPLQFMLDSLPKSQQVYNGYKLQSQQNSVRTLAILKQKIIQNRVQLKWRSADLFINIYKNTSPYLSINSTNVQLRFAGLITGNENDKDISMWFAPGINDTSQFDQNQQKAYNNYLKAQPFIRSILPSNSTKKLPSFQMILNYSGSPMMFKYPTVKDSRFQDPNFRIYFSCYYKTKKNWESYGISYTSLWDDGQYQLCYVILQNSTVFIGVMCLKIPIDSLADQLTILGAPTFNYSTNTYYLVTPLYNDTKPQILFNFNDTNLQSVTYPQNQFFYIPSSEPMEYWNPTYINYQLYLFQLNGKQTYFQTPIQIKDVNGKLINILFLLTKNNFALADFNNQTKITNILISILVPSIILIVISVLLSVVVIKCLLGDLQSGIEQLDQHCQYVLKGSLDANIPQYNKTKDISALYQVCQNLNKLYKVSNQNFYSGPFAERFLKYYQVYELFKEYNYDVQNVEEIIGNCLYNMKQYEKAIEYYDLCIQHSLDNLISQYGSLQKIWELKLRKSKKIKKQSYLLKESILRKRLFKVILCKVWTLKPPFQDPQLQKYIQIFKRSCQSSQITSEYGCIYLFQARYYMMKTKIEKVQQCLNKGQRFLALYEKQYKKNCLEKRAMQYWVPPQILHSYLNFVLGIYSTMTGNNSQACRLYIKALEGNYFAPEINKKVVEQLKNLLKSYNLLTPQVLSTCYFSTFHQAQERQFIILIDWSKSSKVNDQSGKQGRKEKRRNVIGKIKDIFINYLQDKDRMSLIKFSDDTQLVFSLTLKKDNQQLIKRYIDGLRCKSADRASPNLKRALKDTVDRIKILPSLKIIIVFLKDQTIINASKVLPILSELQRYRIIFFKENIDQKQLNSNYFILKLNQKEDFDRILLRKKETQQTNQINPF